MASEYVTFLEQPVVGRPVAFVKSGQRMTSSPVVSVRPDPSSPGAVIIHTASGSTYSGQCQPNYQPTMYATQYAAPPQMPQAPTAACPRCGNQLPPGSLFCARCGMQFGGVGSGSFVNAGNERMWAMLCHISIFVTGFVGPLVILLTMAKDSALIDHHAKEALNFVITLAITGVIVAILCTFCIGYLLAIPLGIYALVAKIIAGVQAYNGQYYTYPVVIRFIN